MLQNMRLRYITCQRLVQRQRWEHWSETDKSVTSPDEDEEQRTSSYKGSPRQYS